jgi:thiol-disulfide isomerase/thioredoxin
VAVRVAVLVAVLASMAAAWVLWRRPPRRLTVRGLSPLGISAPAVVQFTSPSCAPCRAAAPHLRRAAELHGIPFVQIDLSERPEAASDYGIRTVPTIAVAGRDGRVLEVWTALPPPEKLAAAARRASSG